MALGKQAKTLSENQIKLVLKHLEATQEATRNQVMLLLSVDAGLRARLCVDLLHDDGAVK